MSADLPSAGWMTTPPLEPISESNDNTVARCLVGISPLMYACRTGVAAAYTTPQMQTNKITAQKLWNTPISVRATAPNNVAVTKMVVRRWKNRRNCGANTPPAICALAKMPAARPAMP